MKGNFHVQFLGEGAAVTPPPYPPRDAVTAFLAPRNFCARSLSTKTHQSRLITLTGVRVPITQATCATPSSLKSWIQK